MRDLQAGFGVPVFSKIQKRKTTVNCIKLTKRIVFCHQLHNPHKMGGRKRPTRTANIPTAQGGRGKGLNDQN